jgi:hypothetical protein
MEHIDLTQKLKHILSSMLELVEEEIKLIPAVIDDQAPEFEPSTDEEFVNLEP